MRKKEFNGETLYSKILIQKRLPEWKRKETTLNYAHLKKKEKKRGDKKEEKKKQKGARTLLLQRKQFE